MSPEPSVMIVDDDEGFRESTSQLLLAVGGYDVVTVDGLAPMFRALEERDFDVVILDNRLSGTTGKADGVDAIESILRIRPTCSVAIATGFADAMSVRKAFGSGAVDYFDKSSKVFVDLLLNKIRIWTRDAAIRRVERADRDAAELEIANQWKIAQTEQDGNKKGRALELVMLHLFRSVRGFQARTTVRSAMEEIDVQIRNESPDPFWKHFGPFILCECKNWLSRMKVEEIAVFAGKLERRFGQCKLGFFVAMGGYGKPVTGILNAYMLKPFQIVALTREHVDQLVHATDRNALLKQFVEHANVEGAAGK